MASKHIKDVQIPSHQRNVKYNYNKILYDIPRKWLKLKTLTISNITGKNITTGTPIHCW